MCRLRPAVVPTALIPRFHWRVAGFCERIDHDLTVARWNKFVAVVMKFPGGDIFHVANSFRFPLVAIQWEIQAL